MSHHNYSFLWSKYFFTSVAITYPDCGLGIVIFGTLNLDPCCDSWKIRILIVHDLTGSFFGCKYIINFERLSPSHKKISNLICRLCFIFTFLILIRIVIFYNHNPRATLFTIMHYVYLEYCAPVRGLTKPTACITLYKTTLKNLI